ncbi:MAG TPA: tyrosine--tRNA ligase [Candidatus Paceibacterota bacterium]|nr:tyrosine--tRNA ligase [Candidatus Paceibacterota bacterium]
MTLAEELKARGLAEHVSAPIEEILKEPRTAYLGIDPTADSMQIGNLAVVMLMKRLGEAGHKLIFLVGGGTGMIGDPKEKGERVLLDERIVGKNARALKKQLKSVLGSTRFTLVNNADWLMRERLVPFLRDIGKHFTVNELVKRELIAKRLAAPDESISYTEFTYALLQGFDFLTLHEKYGADLQVGASDQWTNILSGVELVRKKAGGAAYAFTMPLITDSAGKKFGKSEGNAVWLDPKKTSPFKFYQFWLQLPDENIEKYLKVYTELSLGDIEALMLRHGAAPQKREAQEALARAVTELVHGPGAAAAAASATSALFGEVPFHKLSREARASALAEAPSLTLSKKDLVEGVSLIDCLVAGSLASSKSEARRLIEQKAITLGGLPIENPEQKVYPSDLPEGFALVRKGKREVLVLVLK